MNGTQEIALKTINGLKMPLEGTFPLNKRRSKEDSRRRKGDNKRSREDNKEEVLPYEGHMATLPVHLNFVTQIFSRYVR